MIGRNHSAAEGVAQSAAQKDKIIQLLQRQLSEGRELKAKYQRLADRKVTLIEKCDSLFKQNVRFCSRRAQPKKNSGRVSTLPPEVSPSRGLRCPTWSPSFRPRTAN